LVTSAVSLDADEQMRRDAVTQSNTAATAANTASTTKCFNDWVLKLW
jgi:hypothetical protein